MNPDLQGGLILAALCGALGWAVRIEHTIAAHDAVIVKLDQLLTLMLEDRLAQDKKRRQARPAGDSSSSDQRGN